MRAESKKEYFFFHDNAIAVQKGERKIGAEAFLESLYRGFEKGTRFTRSKEYSLHDVVNQITNGYHEKQGILLCVWECFVYIVTLPFQWCCGCFVTESQRIDHYAESIKVWYANWPFIPPKGSQLSNETVKTLNSWNPKKIQERINELNGQYYRNIDGLLEIAIYCLRRKIDVDCLSWVAKNAHISFCNNEELQPFVEECRKRGKLAELKKIILESGEGWTSPLKRVFWPVMLQVAIDAKDKEFVREMAKIENISILAEKQVVRAAEMFIAENDLDDALTFAKFIRFDQTGFDLIIRIAGAYTEKKELSKALEAMDLIQTFKTGSEKKQKENIQKRAKQYDALIDTCTTQKKYTLAAKAFPASEERILVKKSIDRLFDEAFEDKDYSNAVAAAKAPFFCRVNNIPISEDLREWRLKAFENLKKIQEQDPGNKEVEQAVREQAVRLMS